MAGVTSLLYDPRTVGQSDGTPRNDINAYKQIEDCSDALTFLASQKIVDPLRVGLWGVSLGGAVSLCCAALDPRAQFVISICPILECTFEENKLPVLLAKSAQDREAQMKGNPPFYHRMFQETGQLTGGFSSVRGTREMALRILGMSTLGSPDSDSNQETSISLNSLNRITMQTTYRTMMWNPLPILKYLNSTPVLYVVPELDEFIPAEVQLKHFENLQAPKQLLVEKQCGHTEIFEREGIQDLLDKQAQFVRNALEGQVES